MTTQRHDFRQHATGSRNHKSAPNSHFPPELRGKGKGVGRVREGRGKNFWGPIWFVPAPPALHLHLPLKKLADWSPNSNRLSGTQSLAFETLPETQRAK
jgi:hypothetical protein